MSDLLCEWVDENKKKTAKGVLWYNVQMKLVLLATNHYHPKNFKGMSRFRKHLVVCLFLWTSLIPALKSAFHRLYIFVKV